MILEELSPAAHAEWDAFVEGRPHATCYHLRAWQRVAQNAYLLEAPHLMARDRPGGPIRGVLPLFIVGGPFGRYATTGLFGAYGGILTDGDFGHGEGVDPRPDEDREVTLALLDQARRITHRLGARYLLVKALGDPPVPDLFVRREQSVIATLALDSDPQLVWKGFKDKQRNSIRKAQKSGLEHRVGADLLAAFYDVLAENMHRKGTPIYGFGVMSELVAALEGKAEIHTLWKDGQVVSGALAIRHRGTMYVPFASSRARFFKLNCNNLLYWEMIQQACRSGATRFDFGRSTRGSSTLAFKLSWGATETVQPVYVYTARGEPPGLVETRAVKKLTELWMALPRPIADALGPAIYRNFLA